MLQKIGDLVVYVVELDTTLDLVAITRFTRSSNSSLKGEPNCGFSFSQKNPPL
jgi:hypothetical protein